MEYYASISSLMFFALYFTVKGQDCDAPDDVLVGDICYTFDEDKTGWDEAVKSCQNNGGILAEVRDDATRNLLEGHASSFTGGPWWIGAREMLLNWTWLDGNELGSFQPWILDKPGIIDVFGTLERGDDSSYNFSSLTIDGESPGYICQKDGTECSNGETIFNNTCYMIKNGIRISFYWFEAYGKCVDWGGQLASIANPEIHDAIRSQLTAAAYWTGLTNLEWIWLDGSRVDQYFFKSPIYRDGTSLCVATEYNAQNEGGKYLLWTRDPCNESKGRICQRDLSIGTTVSESTTEIITTQSTVTAELTTKDVTTATGDTTKVESTTLQTTIESTTKDSTTTVSFTTLESTALPSTTFTPPELTSVDLSTSEITTTHDILTTLEETSTLEPTTLHEITTSQGITTTFEETSTLESTTSQESTIIVDTTVDFDTTTQEITTHQDTTVEPSTNGPTTLELTTLDEMSNITSSSVATTEGMYTTTMLTDSSSSEVTKTSVTTVTSSPITITTIKSVTPPPTVPRTTTAWEGNTTDPALGGNATDSGGEANATDSSTSLTGTAMVSDTTHPSSDTTEPIESSTGLPTSISAVSDITNTNSGTDPTISPMPSNPTASEIPISTTGSSSYTSTPIPKGTTGDTDDLTGPTTDVTGDYDAGGVTESNAGTVAIVVSVAAAVIVAVIIVIVVCMAIKNRPCTPVVQTNGTVFSHLEDIDDGVYKTSHISSMTFPNPLSDKGHYQTWDPKTVRYHGTPLVTDGASDNISSRNYVLRNHDGIWKWDGREVTYLEPENHFNIDPEKRYSERTVTMDLRNADF